MKCKSVLIATILATVLAVSLIGIEEGRAERPDGAKYSDYYLYNFDVKAASPDVPDTIDTPTGSNSKLFTFTAPADYSSLNGWYLIEYTSIDTAGASTDMDTTNDTVEVSIFTSAGDGSPYKEIYNAKHDDFHVTSAVVNGDYVEFDLSDSTLWEQVYFMVEIWCMDSTAALADSSLGCQYKITTEMYAK